VRTLIIAVALVLTATFVGHTQTPQSARSGVYIVGNTPRTVTISQSGTVITTLAVPQGITLSVTYDTGGAVLPVDDGHFTFHGNVEITRQSR